MIPETNWRNDPDFQAMDPKKQQILIELAQTLQGKKLTEALPLMMEWKGNMDREGISFTPEENALLTSLFTRGLTPAGKQQYEFIKPFLKR